MTKDEIIAAIRESPLTEDDFQDVLAALLESIVGNMFIGQGMDLSSGRSASTGTMGRWVHTPNCQSIHADAEPGYGWRGPLGGPGHEHWVDS